MGEIQSTSKAQLYTIQIKDDQDRIAPQICRREKIDDKVVLTPINGLEGNFERVELSTYHSETLDKDVENINIYLWDKDGEYKLSTAWTAVGRSILNSLAGEKELGKLRIGVYGKESNGKMYAQASVNNEGQKTSWKLSIEEQRALTDTVLDKKGEFVKTDYSDLEDKLKSFIDEINSKAKYVKIIADVEEEETPVIADEDLPF